MQRQCPSAYRIYHLYSFPHTISPLNLVLYAYVQHSVPNILSQQRTLSLSAQSNLASQVFLFRDKELSQPATDIVLPSTATYTLYICLQPNKKRLNEIYIDGTCRDIVGGIRVKAVELTSTDADGCLTVAHEETIKFVAVLGKSILSVSHKNIDLGTVHRLGKQLKGMPEKIGHCNIDT